MRFTVRLGLGGAGAMTVLKFPIDDEGGRYGALSYSWNGESISSPPASEAWQPSDNYKNPRELIAQALVEKKFTGTCSSRGEKVA